MAGFVGQTREVKMPSIWIDLDNSPHVPFFRPVAEALRSAGVEVLLTARDAYNVRDLLKLYDMPCRIIGRHHGRRRILKAAGLAVRSAQLLPFAFGQRPALAVSHGSRGQLLAARVAGIPTVVIADYEHVTHVARPDVLIVPELMPAAAVERLAPRVLRYPGIKEDVYAATLTPDPAIRTWLGLADGERLVTARPPATEAHYHNVEGEAVFDASIETLASQPGVRIVLLPRNTAQHAAMVARFGELLSSKRMLIPAQAIDGLNLVWHSDLVVSGGGTMNREAAALGVPVFSTFRGPTGAVDRYLVEQGRLVMLASPQQARERLANLTPTAGLRAAAPTVRPALGALVDHLLALLPRTAVAAAGAVR
jgi:uncharacterized protein